MSAPLPERGASLQRTDDEGEGAAARFGPLPAGPKLNLGCGPVQPEGWINIDGSNRARLANRLWSLDKALVKLGVLPPTEFGPQMRVHNLYKPLPFSDGSVACIYAGQLWEHFRPGDAVRLTRECLRVLAPGGVLRVSVPDGVEFCRQYLALYEHEARQLPQARSPERLRRHVELFFKDIATRRIWLGSIGHTHKWLYDEVQLVSLLQACGFPLVERMRFHHSRIPTVGAVELSDCLIVEGVKGRASASMAA